MSNFEPSPLLREAIVNGTFGERPDDKRDIGQIVKKWLLNENTSDTIPLTKQLHGSKTADDATAAIKCAIQFALSMPISQGVQRNAALLSAHLRGEPPTFDQVHQKGIYSYTNDLNPGPLAQQIIEPNAHKEVQRRFDAADLIIDLGTAKGREVFAYAKRFPNTRVIGVDSSTTAITGAQERREALLQTNRDVAERITFWEKGILETLEELLAIRDKKEQVCVTASSSLHIELPSRERKEIQSLILELVGESGCYAGLHRTIADPFGRPGVLLSRTDGSETRISGVDGKARNFWNTKRQEDHIEEVGGEIIYSETISAPYSTEDPANFGYVVAHKA